MSTTLDGFVIVGGKNDDLADGGAAIACSVETTSAQCAPLLNNLVLAGNQSAVNGGAIYIPRVAGDFAISNSQFIGNASEFGGAISILGISGSVLISNSSFVNNSATASGGAAYVFGHVDFENVTFSGNRVTHFFSGADGGGLFVASGQSNLINVTFFNNEAAFYGGAIAATAPVSIKNSIFWENEAADDAYSDLALYRTANISYSVVKGCPTGITCTSIVSGDPRLSAAGNHGGPTITLLPGFGGSAIDNGDDSMCPLTDQRGISRPQGSHCDIGAVEWLPSDDIVFRNGF